MNQRQWLPPHCKNKIVDSPKRNAVARSPFSQLMPMLVIVVALLLSLPACSSSGSEEQVSHSNVRRRASQEDLQEYYDYLSQFNDTDASIVGGERSTYYPWFVHFASKVCGGSLISPNRILTSASCLRLTGVPSLVRVGAVDRKNGKLAAVACAKTHPDYMYESGTMLADIAILKLTSPVKEVVPVVLNDDPNYPNPLIEQEVVALGLGYTNRNGNFAKRLQELQLKSISANQCQSLYQSTSIIRHGMHLCTVAKSRGLCTGDGGGPLLDRPVGTAPRQLGVASFTYGECGLQNAPDVFSSVGFYHDWIQSQMEDTSCDGIQTPVPTTSMPTISPAPSTSSSPTNSLSPSLAPSTSLSPSQSQSPSLVPSVSSSPTTTPAPTTFAPTEAPAIDIYRVAVDAFNAVINTVGGLVDFKLDIVQKKKGWFQNLRHRFNVTVDDNWP